MVATMNRPFDSALNPIGRPSELEACRKTCRNISRSIPDNKVSSVCSTFFPIPGKNKTKVHGCIDLRLLHRHLMHRRFKMEETHTVRSILHRHDYLAKVDLSDFYMHVLINEAN